MLPKPVLYYGKDEPLPQRIPLRAGPLTLLYENGDLRYINLGEHEIIRRIYVAIRDRNWGTVLPQFSNVSMDIADDTFQIRYDVVNRQDDIDFAWHGEIIGAADGTIRFMMDGVARATFVRNRIGFCLLHPMAVAGAAARIIQVDGRQVTSHFPQHIAPQLVIDGEIKPVLPFHEMETVAHEVTPGVWAEVQFSGEIFEMEDQRNWTDASFKTYGTPLRLPFPVEIQAGTSIQQAVTLTVRTEGDSPVTLPREVVSTSLPIAVEIPDPNLYRPLPLIGVGRASHGQPLTEAAVSGLRSLNLAHLRVDLHLSDAAFVTTLRRATEEAVALSVHLEVALHLTANAASELAALTDAVTAIRPRVARWLVFAQGEKSTTAGWVEQTRAALAEVVAAATIGAGTDVYFTELNRGRPPIEALDLVAYSINPQVHAFDNASLVETLAAQAVTATSARQFISDRLLAITPVTLLPRFNPNATGPTPDPAPGELPPEVDVRQLSLFGAGWTLGSLKYLAECGEVASVTYYETTGWRGVMERTDGSPLPDKFPSFPGGVFPLYHILADVGDFAAGEVIPTVSSDPLRVETLLLSYGERRRLLIANLTDQSQQVTLTGLAPQVGIRRLDETNAEAAMQTPEAYRNQNITLQLTEDGALTLDLLPYAVACLDKT
jgi:hypothetical protein